MPLMGGIIGNSTAYVNSNLTVSQRLRRQSHYWRMDSLKVIVGRINRRLEALGMNASQASEEAGLSKGAIYNLQRGADGRIKLKGGNAATYAALAPILKTTSDWLTQGIGPEVPEDEPDDAPDRPFVRLVGYVGAGAATHFYAVSQGDMDQVEAPDSATPETVAVEVRGDSLGALFDRWLVFYDDVRSPVTPDLIGKLCVVGLADDRVLVKKLRNGRKKGLYQLVSATQDDTIEDVAVDWAAKVNLMTPR